MNFRLDPTTMVKTIELTVVHKGPQEWRGNKVNLRMEQNHVYSFSTADQEQIGPSTYLIERPSSWISTGWMDKDLDTNKHE